MGIRNSKPQYSSNYHNQAHNNNLTTTNNKKKRKLNKFTGRILYPEITWGNYWGMWVVCEAWV